MIHLASAVILSWIPTLRAVVYAKSKMSSIGGAMQRPPRSERQLPNYEPVAVPPSPLPAPDLQHYFEQWRGNDHSPIIATAGKSGVGKSTMINNVLELEGDAKCLTGDDADPTTREVRVHSSLKNNVMVTVVDTPGLGGLNWREKRKVLKDLSKKTREKADILLYCVSLHPAAKIDAADVEIIKMFTSAYGPEIWSHAILVLTYANERTARNHQKYRELIAGYARNFQQALRAANVFGIQVRSILSEVVPKETIPAVPIGLAPNDHLLLCNNWSDALLNEVFKRANPEVNLKLLELKGIFLPAAELTGCIMAGIAAGAAVGTAAGAPVGVLPGMVVGVPAGAAAGGLVGLTMHGLYPLLRNKFLMRKAEKEERRIMQGDH